jgi:hypothetical protein
MKKKRVLTLKPFNAIKAIFICGQVRVK